MFVSDTQSWQITVTLVISVVLRVKGAVTERESRCTCPATEDRDQALVINEDSP